MYIVFIVCWSCLNGLSVSRLFRSTLSPAACCSISGWVGLLYDLFNKLDIILLIIMRDDEKPLAFTSCFHASPPNH